MRSVDLVRPADKVSLLCIGAHADDIEIGAAGAILTWLASGARLSVHWGVASAAGEREAEARASMAALLADASGATFHLGGFRDAYLPYDGAAVKQWMEGLRELQPDIILTHRAGDRHQDHRFLSELTWSVFRDHLILEYEVPKWDGDMGEMNYYIPLTAATLERKTAHLLRHFCSQAGRDWFDAETFRAIARLRGAECRAEERYAEAFYLRKAMASNESAASSSPRP